MYDFVNNKNHVIERDCFARVNYVSVLVDKFIIIHGGEYRDKFNKIRISDQVILFDLSKKKEIPIEC